MNWTRGKHAFKLGVLLNRFNEASQATNSFNGQIIYNTVSDFLAANPLQVEFAPTFATENRDFIFNTYGFYGQDDWRVKQRLTVNLGLRYEFMNTPHELNGRQSRQINDFSDPFTLAPSSKTTQRATSARAWGWPMISSEMGRQQSEAAPESTSTWGTSERLSDKPRTDLCRMQDWSILTRAPHPAPPGITQPCSPR